MTTPHHEDIEGNGTTWSDAYTDQVAAVIQDHGWAVQGVFATETSDLKFDFAYTVGLIQRGCSAELLITGIPVQTAAAILNEIAAHMTTSGQLIPPSEWAVPGGYVLKTKSFVPRQGSDIHLGVARAYYQRSDVPVVQYVWPNKNHQYPWDEGWDRSMLQPYGNG
jgi:hypothetical protein